MFVYHPYTESTDHPQRNQSLKQSREIELKKRKHSHTKSFSKTAYQHLNLMFLRATPRVVFPCEVSSWAETLYKHSLEEA